MVPNQQGPTNLRKLVKTWRIVWAAMLFSQLMYIVVVKRLHPASTVPLDRTVQSGIAMCGIVAGAAALYLRFVRIAGLISPIEPIDEKTRARKVWANYVVSYVLCESIVLFGFALEFMHGDPKYYGSLYLGGVLLMLLCYPRLPTNE